MKALFENKGKKKQPPPAPRSDAEVRGRRRKAGYCELCGEVKTHGRFLLTLQPLSIPGQVYKGFCLTCHSITEIQCRLAEPLGTPSIDCPEHRLVGPRAQADSDNLVCDLPVRRGVSEGSGTVPSSSNGNTGGSHGHNHIGSHDAGRAAGDHSPGGGPLGASHGDNHEHRRHRSRGGEGRPHSETKNAAEGVPNGTGHREEYFNTQHQQNESRRGRGVPGFIEPQVEDDSATVVSELTLDPVFAAQNHGNPMMGGNLSGIAEAKQAGDGDDDEGNEASGGSRDHKGDHDRDHSSSSSGTSHKQSTGGSTGNNQARAGSATSGDSRFETLLEKKIKAEDAERRGSRAASSVDQHSGRTKQTMTNGGTSNYQARAGSVTSSDSKFKNLLEDKMKAAGVECRGSSGSQLDGEKKQSNSTANGQARAESVSCGDNNFKRLLENKMEAEKAERGGSGARPRGDTSEGKRFTYRGGVLGSQRAQVAVSGTDAGRARPGAQAVRKGTILDSMINKKEANEVARSRSLCAPLLPPRDGDEARSHSLPLGGRHLALASDEEGRRHNLTFCDGAGEGEVSDCLCSNLRLRATPDIFLSKIACLRTNAIRAMKAFPMSADINDYACKLLACTFAMASEHNITGRDGADLEELEAVTSSIVQHKCNAEVAAAACSALRNFCIMSTPFDHCSPTGLNGLLSKACDEIAKSLVIHQRNERYLEQATGALQALCAMRGGLALSFESGSIIGLLVGALDRYPSAKNLQRHIIGIVGCFFSVSNEIKDSISCDLVAAIMRFIDAEIANDDEEASTNCVDIAVNIILVISNQGFNEVQVLLNENVADTIGSVINCMWKWPHDPSIQSACIDVLSNLSVNNSLWDEVCQRGGVSCMLSALSNLNHDPVLVCKAFEAFTNLMLSGTDVMGILDAHDPPVPAILVSAMTAHEDELPIQARGAHVIWATSSKTNSLKEEFLTLGGAEAVAGAMMRFTASRQMQLRGFYAIWSLAVPRHLKTRVGRCAIGPVVNGLSAHFLSENRSESTEVCERALGCVKCLSTSSRNKALLRESGAIDVIYSCIWMHLENVAICGAALAAICNICVDVDTNQVVEITQEDLDAVVAALRIHRHTKLIQETAIVLLKNFTFSRSNMAILERNPFLIALVRSAMSNIDDNHRESANHLLRVLPLAC